MIHYINIRIDNEVETVDEFPTLAEAEKMLVEYKLVDPNHYLSTRSTKHWKEEGAHV